MEKIKIKKYANVICFHTFNFIGGTEQYVYEMLYKYGKSHDITVFYCETKDYKQIKRLKDLIGEDNVIHYTEPYQPIDCEVAILNYDLEPFISNIYAKKVIDVVHANLYLENYDIPEHQKIDTYLGVSQSVCGGFMKQCKIKGKNKKINKCYNPISLREGDKDRVLFLVSATRLTKEKGLERMKVLANQLDKANVKYVWLVFTNQIDQIFNSNVIYMKPRLDIRPFLNKADYVVQLSSSEGYCYTILESLMLGTPVITTDLETFREMGVVNGKNGYLLPLDMKHIPIQEIYVKQLKGFKYTPRKDDYEKYLYKGKTTYLEEKIMKVKMIKPVFDERAKVHYVSPREYALIKVNAKDGFENKPIGTIVDLEKSRADVIVKAGYGVYVDEVSKIKKPRATKTNLKRVK